MFYRQARIQSKFQVCVSFAKGCFRVSGRVCLGEKEAQVARAFGPGRDVVVQASGDVEFGDVCSGAGFLFSGDAFEDAAAWDRDHHHGRGAGFTLGVAAGQAYRVTKQEFFEPDRFGGRSNAASPIDETQRACAEAADRTWRNFQRPGAFVVNAEFGMDWAVREAQRAHGLCRAILDSASLRFG